MHDMMESSSEADNECSSTSVDITMTTRRTSSVQEEMDKNVVDGGVTSTSEEVDENIVLDMSMPGRNGQVILSPPSSPPIMMNDDNNIESPAAESESEELTIDEKFAPEDSTADEVTPMEIGDNNVVASPTQESSNKSDQNDEVDTTVISASSSDELIIRSPSPQIMMNNDDETVQNAEVSAAPSSPPPPPVTYNDDIASPESESEELTIDEAPEDDSTLVEVTEKTPIETISSPPPHQSQNDTTTTTVDYPSDIIRSPSPVHNNNETIENLPIGPSSLHQAPIKYDEDIESPEEEEESESEELTIDENKCPAAPVVDVTPMDIVDEEKVPSPPQQSGLKDDEDEDDIKPTVNNVSASELIASPSSVHNNIEAEEVDLEDGEIMDEEEEEEEEDAAEEVEAAKAKARSQSSPAATPPQRESSKSSSGSKKKDKRDKENKKEEKEELDPVKRLLAEVKEKDMKDKSEKEKERERRRNKKRTKKENEKEHNSKKKKRRMSEEEDDGEEFLLVRGASPTDAADGWGDDFSRSKRRRESEGSSSPPHNRNHRRQAEVVMSPPRARAPVERPKRPVERKEPKSDVICAYFMQGKCQKSSDDCNFSHDAIPPRKMELCKFWMMDCCAKKEKCIYLHNDFPCKFYHTGLICRLADRCKFSHQPLSEATKQVLLKHIETAPKEILGDFPRLNRAGALNLINKMEAKINGVPYHEDESHKGNDNHMDHGPPQYGHQQQHQDNRHGPHGHGGHDRSRGDRNQNHYGQNHHDHSGRGRGQGGDNRGGDRGGGQGDRRQSRWEQTQPTRDDQHKLQELMDEAGIAGFYKDTLEANNPQQTPQNQMFPPQMQNLQPPLLPHPLLPQFLPHMLPQTQGLPQVNNPALASVLANLNIPSSTIVPNNINQFQPPPLLPNPPGLPSGPPPQISQSQQQDNNNQTQDSSADNSNVIPDNLPKMQRDLFLRIQQQQLKNENKVQTQVKEPEEPEENWYSDEEEEDSKKKEELKAEINDQISSVLNQIRQQSQQQQQPAVKKEADGLKTFFGDTDLRASTPASTDFKDVDLRTNNMFKKIDIVPATEINASLAANGPMVYKVLIVAGLRDKPDYSSVRQTLTTSAILMDPRLGPKRSNSIPTPDSPTDQAADGALNQPLNIPDGTPVFDPRTMRGGGGSSNNNNQQPPPRMDQPPPSMFQQDNSMQGMNDYSNPFNRDPRGGPNQNQVQQSQQSPQTMAGNAVAAQNLALAAALMQQQWPNQQPPIDPNLFMLGFPFLPPVTSGQQQQQQQNLPNPGMDFNSLMGAGMRLRPPFNQQHQQQQQQQQPPSSSWERFSQGQGQGDLSPPL